MQNAEKEKAQRQMQSSEHVPPQPEPVILPSEPVTPPPEPIMPPSEPITTPPEPLDFLTPMHASPPSIAGASKRPSHRDPSRHRRSERSHPGKARQTPDSR